MRCIPMISSNIHDIAKQYRTRMNIHQHRILFLYLFLMTRLSQASSVYKSLTGFISFKQLTDTFGLKLRCNGTLLKSEKPPLISRIDCIQRVCNTIDIALIDGVSFASNFSFVENLSFVVPCAALCTKAPPSNKLISKGLKIILVDFIKVIESIGIFYCNVAAIDLKL